MQRFIFSVLAGAMLLGCGSTPPLDQSTELVTETEPQNPIVENSALDNKLKDSGVEIVRDGYRVNLVLSNELLFETDKSVLTAAAKDVLKMVSGALKENTALNLDIVGHSDSSGNIYYNQELSFERSRQVQKFLRTLDVMNTTKIRSYGKLKPKCENDTEAGMMCNRRVELTIF